MIVIQLKLKKIKTTKHRGNLKMGKAFDIYNAEIGLEILQIFDLQKMEPLEESQLLAMLQIAAYSDKA